MTKSQKEHLDSLVTDERRQEWALWGQYFGYPYCCILQFCLGGISDRTEEMSKASGGTGFIPCHEHAKLILKGKITLESLIKDRDPLAPKFPND